MTAGKAVVPIVCSVIFLIYVSGVSYVMQTLQKIPFVEQVVQLDSGTSKVFLSPRKSTVAADLAQWVRNGGGFIGDLQAVDGQYGRSVVATRSIPKGQLVIRIPMSLAITPSVYNASMPRSFQTWRAPRDKDFYNRWMRQKQGLRSLPNETTENDWKRLALAAYVSAHAAPKRADQSKFSLYFESVPAPDADIWGSMPRFWTQEQLAFLNGSHAGEALAWDKERFQHLFDVAHEGFSRNVFQWGLAIVSSRAFSVSFSRHNTSSILLPWADLLNDDVEKPHLRWFYNKEVDAMDFVSEQEVLQGEEVTTSYGPHSNLNLLRSYGFTNHELRPNYQVLRYTPAARFVMTIADVSRLVDIPAKETKEKLLNQQGNIMRPEFRFLQFIDRDQFYKLLQYARFLMLPGASPDDLAKYGCQPQQPVFGCHSALDPTHEANALRLLSSFARTKLAAYSTTLQDDERMLALELKPWKASSLRLLRDEKRPFAYIQQLVERLLPLTKSGTSVPLDNVHDGSADCEGLFDPLDAEVYWKCHMDRVIAQYASQQKLYG